MVAVRFSVWMDSWRFYVGFIGNTLLSFRDVRQEENGGHPASRLMAALCKEFGVAPGAIPLFAAVAHSATLAPMQTLDINATHPWLILRIFTDDTAGKVRRLCASPDGPHDATGRFDCDEDFKEQLETLNKELETLNAQACDLEQAIAGYGLEGEIKHGGAGNCEARNANVESSFHE